MNAINSPNVLGDYPPVELALDRREEFADISTTSAPEARSYAQRNAFHSLFKLNGK